MYWNVTKHINTHLNIFILHHAIDFSWKKFLGQDYGDLQHNSFLQSHLQMVQSACHFSWTKMDSDLCSTRQKNILKTDYPNKQDILNSFYKIICIPISISNADNGNIFCSLSNSTGILSLTTFTTFCFTRHCCLSYYITELLLLVINYFLKKQQTDMILLGF